VARSVTAWRGSWLIFGVPSLQVGAPWSAEGALSPAEMGIDSSCAMREVLGVRQRGANARAGEGDYGER